MARLSDQQKIGKCIKHYRKQADLTQERLSHITGLSQTYLSGVETGKRNPSIKTLGTIAKALRVSIHELTDFESYKLHEQSRISKH